MSRLKCRCGTDLSNSNNPEIEYEVFSDEEYISLMERSSKELDAVLHSPLPEQSFWKCPDCKRLAFFKKGSDVATWYKLED